jgi:hypothetical protein
VLSACASAHGAGGYQRNCYCTGYGVARVIALAASQDNTGTADTARMPRESREHSILGIGASLRASRFVFTDNLDMHWIQRNKPPARFGAVAIV